MTDAEKSCRNCDHRSGRQCVRVGFYCKTEMAYGGRCAQGMDGHELRLWVKRRTLWTRIADYFKIATKGAAKP